MHTGRVLLGGGNTEGAFACFVSESAGNEGRANSSDVLRVSFGLVSLDTIFVRIFFLGGGRPGGLLAIEFDLDNGFFVFVRG